MKRNYFYVLFWVFFCLISGSCKIGLGEAIDTESPKINITSPYEGAVIRDKFAIKGTYSDDGKIKSIKLDLNNLVTGQSSTYNAEFTKDSYSFTVDPLKDGVKDGNYLANITITDTYGHSTQVSSPYTIDNTAPVIILSRPESKKGSDSFDMFGQEFKIEGRAHDDNEIEIEVQIFDKGQAEDSTESEVLLLTKTLNNVNRSIELTVLDAKNEPAEYEKVYGKISTDKNETKNLYCKIIAKDSSKRFPVSETEILPTDNLGNVIETYYLESEFEEVIQASYSATDLYKLLNGTFETSERQVDESIKIEDIQKLLNENKISRGQFSLNPANNPNFEVTNFNSPLKKDGKDFDGEDYKLTRGSSITVKVNSGLDGTYIQGKSLGVYVIECDKSGKILENANKIWLIKPEMELVIGEDGLTSTKNIEITEDELALRKAALETQIGVEKSKSYTFKSIELKASKTGMMLGKNYLIFVEGFDSNKTKVSNFTKDYGFYFAPKDAAPSLTLEQPSENTTYLAKGKSLKVKGSSTTEMGSPIIEIRVRDKNDEKVVKTLEKELVVKENDDLSNTSTFEYEIPATDFKQDESDEYVVSVVAKIADKETIKEKTISYDVGKPEILIQSVTPVVQKNEKNNLNKIINIKGSVTDSFTGVQTEKLKYSLLQNGEEKLSGGITTPSNFTITIDTASLTDKKDVVIKFYAEDKAGNKEERSETYFVDQSTDIPEIGSNDKSWDAQIDTEQKLQESIVAGNKNNIFTSGGSIVFNIVDDDGISVVTVNDKKYELNGSPLETSVSYVLPTSSGRNKLDVTVEDIFGVEKKLTVWVQVTGAAPKVTLRASPEYFSRNTNKVPGTPDKITISGVNEGADPFKIEVLGEKTDYSSDVITGSDDKNVNWTHSFVPKSKDINKIKYKVSDYWGIFTETEISFKEDSERPVVEMPDSNMPTVAATEASSFKFKGTSSDVGSVVEKVQVSFDGINWQDAVGTNEWSYTSIFAEEKGFETEGEKTIHVRNFDTAGNYSVALSKTFVFDKAVPEGKIKTSTGKEITESSLFEADKFSLIVEGKDSYEVSKLILKQVTENGEKTVERIVSGAEVSCVIENLPLRNNNEPVTTGKYDYTLTVIDKAGKETTVKATIVIDKSAPVVEIKTPDSSYEGISAISNNEYVFTGTATENGTYESGVDSYSYLLKAKNVAPTENDVWINSSTGTNWTFTKAIGNADGQLREGKYTLYVKAKDKAGNESPYVSRNFDVDKAKPVQLLSLNPVKENGIYDDTFSIVGKIYDTHGVEKVDVKILNAKTNAVVHTYASVTNITATSEPTEDNLTQEISVGSEGVIKTDGSYIVVVTTTDKVGKTSEDTYPITIDRDMPTVNITSHGENNEIESLTLISGTASDTGSGVSSSGGTYVIKQGDIEVDNGTLEINESNGNWNARVPNSVFESESRQEGPYEISVTIKDKVDHYATAKRTVIYDKAVPQLKVTNPNGNSLVTKTDIQLGGKAWDSYGLKESGSVQIVVKDSTGTVKRTYTPEVTVATSEPESDNWTQTIKLAASGTAGQAGYESALTDGMYTIEIKAEDKVGKISNPVVTKSVQIDTIAPTVSVKDEDMPTPLQTEGTNFNFKGTASDENGSEVKKVEISFDNQNWQQAVGTDSWSYRSIFAEEAQFGTEEQKTLYVKATDNAGNVSEIYKKTFIFDKAHPVGKIKDSSGSDKTNSPFFEGGEFSLILEGTDSYGVSSMKLIQKKNGEDKREQTLDISAGTVKTVSGLPWRNANGEVQTGAYEYSLVITDKAGKITTVSTTVSIDKTAPVVKITNPLATDVGLNSISGTSCFFKGTVTDEGDGQSGVESYSYVIKTQGNPVQSSDTWTETNSGSTNWSFAKEIGNAQDQLAEGKYTLYVKATDKAGNESTVVSRNFDIDTANPVVSDIALSPSNGTNTYDANFTVVGKIHDTHGVDTVTISILKASDNSPVGESWNITGITANSAPESNNLNAEISVGENEKITADGKYVVKVSVKDKVGKETVVTQNVTVDRTGPDVEITSHTENDVVNAVKTISGTANDEGSGLASGTYKLYYTEGETTQEISLTAEQCKLNIKANGNWDATIPENTLQKQGKYTIKVSIKDKAGFETTKSVNIVYDNALPQLKITAPSANSITTNTNITFSGKVWDTYGLPDENVEDGKATGGIQIEIKDSDGTKVGEILKPTVTLANSDPGNSNWTQEITVADDGNIKQDGNYTIEVKAIDKVGKESSLQIFEVLIDRKKPTISNLKVNLTAADWGNDGTNTVYNITQIPIILEASDTGTSSSGIQTVEYTTLNSTDNNYADSFRALRLNKEGKWTETVTCDWQGQKTITVRAIDKAGNEIEGSLPVCIDTTAPESDDITSDKGESILVDGENPVLVTINATDDENETYNSGIKTVRIIQIGNAKNLNVVATSKEIEDPNDSSKKITVYECSLPKENLTADGKVVVEVTDNAKNVTKKDLFDISVDKINPVVKIDDPKDADTTATDIQVNGLIQLTGTASDNKGLKEAKVVLEYSIDNSSWTKIDDVEIDSDTSSWKKEINTRTDFKDSEGKVVAVADGTKVYIKASATDKAERVGTVTTEIIVDQRTDEPIIKLNNVTKIDEMTSSKAIWHKQEYLYGTVSDDDGDVTELMISSDDGTTWSNILLNSGSWEYKCVEGAQTLCFKVTDAGSESESESTYNVFDSTTTRQPKISGTEERKLYLKVDTVQPTIDYIWFRTDGFESTTDYLSETYNKLKNGDLTTGWIVSDSLPRTVVGGPGSKLYVMYVSSDANGIRETEAQIKKDDKNNVVSKKISETTFEDEKIKGEIKVVEFDITGLDEKDKNQLKITAYDNATAKDETKGSYTRTIEMTADNTPPTVEFGTMQNVYYGSVGYTINGRRSDTNKITELYFALTKKSTESTEPTEPEDDEFFSIAEYQPGETAWSISFDGRTNDAFSTSFYTKLLNDYLDDLYGAGTKEKDAVKEVYLWIYAKDELGNTSEKVHELIQVSPQGDKPSVKIEVPENGKSTGGTIRISGTTDIKTSSVDSVWIQIDPDYNGSSFASDWKTKLENIIGDKLVGYKIDDAPKYKNNDNEEKPIEALSGGAIKAKGEASWNLVINKLEEFKKTDNTNTKVAIKVYAVSKTGKVSNVDEISFEIDPNSPVIGDSAPLELVQYSDNANGTGDIVARMNYESGMWIKGKWYLTGSVEDDSGIESITWAENNGTTRELTNTNEVKPYENINYLLNIPVGNEAKGSYGKLEYTLTVIEKGDQPKPTSQTIVLNYDNQAPEFSATLKETDNEIYQSNGTYSVNGTFTEEGNSSGGNQSGFNRIVMYFTRSYGDGNNKRKYLVDPMISGGDSGIENRYQYTISDPDKDNLQEEESDSNFILKNCIYWRKSQANIDDNGNITLSSLPANVRVGGLCMINNVIYRIQTVNGSKVTIDKPITKQTVDVYFALAQVIDNTTVESGTTEAYKENSVNKDNDTHTNGDGDQMIEGVRINGATYNWTASIDSSLIYDGPITIHFVAFDAAGNMTYKLYSGNVSNNAPRIAGVSFGTDNNGDGKITDDEMITAYSGLYNKDSENKQTGVTQNGKKANGQNVSVFNVGYNEYDKEWETAVVVKGDVKVVPEIVGGNSGLGYSVMQGDTILKNYTDYKNVGHSSDGSIRPTKDLDLGIDLEITLTVKDFLDNSIPDGTKQFSFKIWDKTEGTTPGVDSQHADINIQMNVMLKDTTPPTVTIDPFYWESKDKNSLYGNSRENGHIELEDDLPNTFIPNNQNDSIMDTDPKVSGKITIEGTANDNVLLMELGVKTNTTFGTTTTFGSTGYTPIAKRVNGTWVSQGKFTNNGWEFEAVEETNTQTEGNTLKWKLHLDTEKVSGTAVADFKLQVQAKDRGSALSAKEVEENGVKKIVVTYAAGNESVQSSTQTGEKQSSTQTEEKRVLTNFYKMDIVPYITGVQTNLSNLDVNNPSVYNRTALGHYSVNSTETINIFGFNLSNGKLYDEKNTSLDLTENQLTVDSYYGSKGRKYYSVPMTKTEGTTTTEIKSGLVKIVVNSIESINNMNDNNANGLYDVEDNSDIGTESIFENYYNRIPNGINNNKLTDDFELDVWEFDSEAAKPKSGKLLYPIMKISPATGMIQFAFADGPLYFSMGGGKYLDDTTSYDYWCGSYDMFTSVGYAIDDYGYTYGCAAGGDINADSADHFCLFTSRFGNPAVMRSQRGSMQHTVGMRMEQIGQNNGTGNTNAYDYIKERIKSPSITTSIHTENRIDYTNVYMAYFDDMNQEIRFKSGSTNATGETEFGLFKDLFNPGGGNSTPGRYSKDNVNIVASNEREDSKNGYTAGEFVSIAVIPGSTRTNDVVVLVWYDGNTLYYTYNTKPLQDDNNNNLAGKYSFEDGVNNNGWQTPTPVFSSGVGEYCKIAVDKKKGIHVVAYDSLSSDVKYAYATSYDSGFNVECTVDSYGIIGSELSLDIAMENGKAKPYISYYAASAKRPKIAYLKNVDEMENGSISDRYTQHWEVSFLPTTSRVPEDHINVGLWKKGSTGEIVNSLTKATWDAWQENNGTAYKANAKSVTKGTGDEVNGGGTGYGTASWGYKFANGTNNPMLAYQVGSGASTTLETAQMK